MGGATMEEEVVGNNNTEARINGRCVLLPFGAPVERRDSTREWSRHTHIYIHSCKHMCSPEHGRQHCASQTKQKLAANSHCCCGTQSCSCDPSLPLSQCPTLAAPWPATFGNVNAPWPNERPRVWPVRLLGRLAPWPTPTSAKPPSLPHRCVYQ